MVLRRLSALVVVVIWFTSPSTRHARAQCELAPPVEVAADDGVPGDGFGSSLALDNDVLVAGAPSHDVNGLTHAGAVYVFRRISGVWRQEQKLSAADSAAGDQFGYAVSVSGNVIVIGAPFGDGMEVGAGAAYVFRFTGNSWVQSQKLIASDGESVADFGGAVALHGQVAVIGAWNAKLEVPLASSRQPAGAAYVFREINGVWSEEQKLTEPDPLADNLFGIRVATDGNRVAVVAALNQVVHWGYSEGIVYVFSQIASAWSVEREMLTTNRLVADFGFAGFAFDGDSLLVGAPSYFYSDSPWPGSVVSFDKLGNSWFQGQELRAADGQPRDRFGASIALVNDLLVVGASRDDDVGTDAGAVYLFRRMQNRWQQIRKLFGPSPSLSHGFGSMVATNGEVVAVTWAPNNSIVLIQPQNDCNANGIVDECDLAQGTSVDCNANQVPDECEPDADCNANGIQDICDIASGASADCNHNFIPDECESSNDCNGNGIQDVCEINRALNDCQQDGYLDACEIAAGVSPDNNDDGIPDECQCRMCSPPSTPRRPCLRLLSVAINGAAMTPSAEVTVRPGDTITAELTLSCWGSIVPLVKTYQAQIDGLNGAQSGMSGSVRPRGWDAPLTRQNPPCNDPRFPITSAAYGCVGPGFNPQLGANIDTVRADYLLSGFPVISAVAVDYLNMKWGATIFLTGEGVPDDGRSRYLGTFWLVASPDAFGTFSFRFISNVNSTFISDPALAPYSTTMSLEPLIIRVQCDDGVFCNGLETQDPAVGCVPGTPPNCDDGVACTIDSCDETIHGCQHVPNDALCDDGDPCTRDQCTLTGCVNVDDMCSPIPTASQWGLVVLTLLLLSAAKVRFGFAPRGNRFP